MLGADAAAAGLFLSWAEFWRLPDEEFCQAAADGRLDAAIDEQTAAACLLPWRPAKSFRQLAPPLSALRSFYQRCFVGIGRSTALPVESVYKPWTEDPAARLPIAGSAGYLLGDAALHVRYLLDHYGFAVPAEYQMMPDHLSLLLELAAFLLEQRTPGEARLFLVQHLDWLADFAQAVGELGCEHESEQQAQHFYLLALDGLQYTVNCQMKGLPTCKE